MDLLQAILARETVEAAALVCLSVRLVRACIVRWPPSVRLLGEIDGSLDGVVCSAVRVALQASHVLDLVDPLLAPVQQEQSLVSLAQC